ncbi:helix-turn-helix transcriptional regulator [Spirosoma sp. BT702]|uniref:Helix-turn-helix transcriptional regulator n=1 Tax=Spirosoma profusum TaxID=2771354 RepID=A0A927AWB7_9BACT|nr:helix-turn-helix transcriptional regulator [Spirosoma profusum]MBD2705525.1 helix-turn-helix transcriptional regulator [Spirosoma profusum]MBD2705584.1 helix-turn-helix transcriptional regulator [Spirosoma profusum]
MTVNLDLRKLAKALDEKRYKERVTLRELSKELGVSTSTLSRLESGRMPDLTTYIIVCRYLNRPFNHFFTVD